MFTDNDVPSSQIPKGVVAPNLKLTADRLQHTWTPRWLEDPHVLLRDPRPPQAAGCALGDKGKCKISKSNAILIRLIDFPCNSS